MTVAERSILARCRQKVADLWNKAQHETRLLPITQSLSFPPRRIEKLLDARSTLWSILTGGNQQAYAVPTINSLSKRQKPVLVTNTKVKMYVFLAMCDNKKV